MGQANLAKAVGFHQQRNYVQALRYGEIAATKLKKLKDRRLETVQVIDRALEYQFNSLNYMGRNREAMEHAEERYTLWAMNHLRNPGSMKAALALIESCILNKKYEDAEHYARHAMFMINEMTDNFIPSDQRSQFLADGSHCLAQAIHRLSKAGGIPPEGKQKAGEEAITLARQALELNTQLHGAESGKLAIVKGVLADTLDHFNDVDDDEVLRLYEQAISIHRRVEGILSVNVAAVEGNLGMVYQSRAVRAATVEPQDLNRSVINFELALSHYEEAARIYEAMHLIDNANAALGNIANTKLNIQQMRSAMAAGATTRVTTITTKG